MPSAECLAEALSSQPGSGAVREEYLKIVQGLGNEFAVLMDVPLDEVARHTRPRVVEALRRMRDGLIEIKPGYDGTFGEIRIFGGAAEESKVTQPAQTSLF